MKKVDKRRRIIETALNLFVNQGLQQTSMAQLSNESGVAVGTMYHHFKSKNELIEAIFLFINEELGKATTFTEDENKLEYKKRFELLWKKGYEFYVNNPLYFFFHDTHNYSPLISNELRNESRKNYQEAINIVNEGLENKTFIDVHPILVLRWIYNTMVALIQIKLNSSSEVEVTNKMIKQTIKMTWKGLT